jgi:16S rRNA (guanine527-N7)-methyltransferase
VAQPDLAADRASALALVAVSRETENRLNRFVAVLMEWQQRMNLIAASTEPTIWTRHIADSLQLLALAPDARTWVDLGSGAGFPGLAIACALADDPAARVHLVEKTAKKAAFLEAAISATGAPATVHTKRIEDFTKTFTDPVEFVAARALAPLSELLDLAYPLLKRGAKGLFLKGQDVGTELTEAAKCWNVQARLVPSRTDPRAAIVIVNSAEPRTNPRPKGRAKRI